MFTIGEYVLDNTDRAILKNVNESIDGIRLAELGRRVNLKTGALRWRVLDLSSRGLLRINRSRCKVTVYPALEVLQ